MANSSYTLPQPEAEIATLLAAGDREQAAVLTLRAYGPEILGFLCSQLREEQHAREVFSMFAEDLWRGLQDLSLRSSMRAFAYTLARNAKNRFLERDLRKQRAAVPLSAASIVHEIVQNARTETAPHLITANKDKLAALRARLSPDEQALLTLRIDRGLEWSEVAEVLAEGEDPIRGAAQLRKRYQLLKERLARWAREEGLLGDGEP